PKLWKSTFDRAAGEVYATPQSECQRLFALAYDEQLDVELVAQEREKSKAGDENDGLRYARTGEGPYHKALRLWVHANPGSVRRQFSNAVSETDFVLASADRVDVLFRTEDRVMAVAVKSRASNLADLRRGLFQCIKYR